MRAQQLQIGKAYQKVNIIDQHGKNLSQKQSGTRALTKLLKISNIEQQIEEGIEIAQQPLFTQQVDHHIQEVGIMAIKQVKYVTERQWQKMLALQKDQQQIWDYLQKISRFQKRHKIAKQIPRNQRGQFSTKTKKQKKQTRPKGRPPKHKKQQQKINQNFK